MRLKGNIPTISAVKEALLIRKAKKGSKEAFGKLYLIYLDEIYRYIFFKLGQEKQVAEDITQEVFLKAFEKIKKFKNKKRGGFRAWLYAVARNQTIDYLRTNGKTVNLEVKVADKKHNPEKKTVVKEEYKNLLKAIGKLSRLQKEIITMAYINDLSNGEIADILGKSDEAVRAAKYRGLKNLKKTANHEL